MNEKDKDKELLLKDVCSRLPYNLKCEYNGEIYEVLGVAHGRVSVVKPFMSNSKSPLIEEVKPYLFPLSSMTEEQKKYIDNRWGINEDFDFEIDPNWGTYVVDLGDVIDFINWLIENHFDFNGLIPKDRAIDASGLSIY